jgi:hypothetical protein
MDSPVVLFCGEGEMAKIVGVVLMGLTLMVGAGLSGEKKIKGQLPPGWKKLDLSKEQVLKIYTIQGQYRSKIRMLEEQLKELREQERGEMFKVLTKDQKEKARKILLGESTTSPKEK